MGPKGTVLRGASKILSSQPQPSLIVELAEENQQRFGRSYKEIADLLVAHGYDLSYIQRDGTMRPYKPWDPECPFFNLAASPRDNASNDLVA